jgi:hypothetical protein
LEAQEFLKSLYPSLSGKGYIMSVETFPHYDEPADYTTSFSIHVGEGPKDFVVSYIGGYTGPKPPENYHPGPVFAKQVLDSHFQFDKTGKLIRFNAARPTVEMPDQFARVYELVKNHPKMSDIEVNNALTRAGAKYGPWNANEFRKNMPMQRIEHFLGKLNVTSVEFIGRTEERFVPDDWATWKVMAKSNGTDDETHVYQLTFETFRGDLVALSTIPWPPKAELEK